MIKKQNFSGLAFLACLSFCIIGCDLNPEQKAIVYNKDTATTTKVITFNTTNATYLATQWTTKENPDRSAAREGDETESEEVESTQSLVAVVGDEVKEVIDLPEELKLAPWCQPRPVREVYKCPYPTIEYEAKGFYTVFSDRIDTNNDSWWQYEDGSPAPNVGQIMYVKPDGTVIDILNFENNVNRQLTTWIKENDGEDYIQFDDDGNIFILTKDYSVGKTVVYRYNPMNDKVDGYTLNVNGDIDIRNFRVTRDGKWIFLNVMLRHRENNVYALQVNSKAKPIPMYEYSGELPAVGQDPQWAVSSIEINPTTNEVYWVVCTYRDDTRAGTGVYVASRSTNGEYRADRVKRYSTIQFWPFENAVEKYITGATVTNPDYQGLLNYLKDMCKSTTANLDNVEFTLEYFKNCKKEVKKYNGEILEVDFSPLYAEDVNGAPLTDVEALEYIINTTLESYYGVPKSEGKNLYDTLFHDFYYDYWRIPVIEDGHLSSGNSGCIKEGYNSSAFPWGYFLVDKTTKKPAVNTDFNKGHFAQADSGYILSNDEGVWLMNDVWDDAANNGAGAHIYAQIYNLTDEKGHFSSEQPGDILTQHDFCTQDSCRRKSNDDPWYKKPIIANTTAIAALSIDKKTIYLHKQGLTSDLLGNDPNKASIKEIYAFNLEEEQLIYNAKTTEDKFIMVSIDLETRTASKLPLKSRVESMMGMWSEE